MTVKRYFSATARDCLRKVKEDLGPDAIVVSSKAVQGGVEITAMPAEAVGEISGRAGAAEYVEEGRLARAGGSRYAAGFAPASTGDFTVSHSARAQRFDKYAASEPVPAVKRAAVSSSPLRHEPTIKKVIPPPSAAATSHPVLNLVMMREMRDIRRLLEQQLAGFAWGKLSCNAPVLAQLMTELLEMGFSGIMARRMTQDMKVGMTLEEGRRHVTATLDCRLRLFDADSDLIRRGGVYALVGPTGVGKTTTTAKLAARGVLHHGADRIALVTTDGYHIAAHEQLRIYGRILGVAVYPVGTGDELRQTLTSLKDKHMVLVDTAGMSQRDRLVVEQGNMLAGSPAVKRLLLLNAISRGDTLDDVIGAFGGEDIFACIVSKADEAVSLAPVVDAVVRHGMAVAYLANGQSVPEDLHLPNRKYLLHRVFKQPQGNMAHRLKLEETGMALASTGLHDRAYGID